MALCQLQGLGLRRLRRLWCRFGSAEAIVEAPWIEIARLPRLDPELAQRIPHVRQDVARYERHLEFLVSQGIQLLAIDERSYPLRLRELPDPPMLLACWGPVELLQRPTVAIVGSRYPTADARKCVCEVVTALVARGWCIASGLAAGVDSEAHRTALECRGATLGIPGTDILSALQRAFVREVGAVGLLLSEHLLRTEATAANLVRRNRLISGVASLVLVVQGERGAWHTARFAQQQGRPILLCHTSDERYAQLRPLAALDPRQPTVDIVAWCEEIRRKGGGTRASLDGEWLEGIVLRGRNGFLG